MCLALQAVFFPAAKVINTNFLNVSENEILYKNQLITVANSILSGISESGIFFENFNIILRNMKSTKNDFLTIKN